VTLVLCVGPPLSLFRTDSVVVWLLAPPANHAPNNLPHGCVPISIVPASTEWPTMQMLSMPFCRCARHCVPIVVSCYQCPAFTFRMDENKVGTQKWLGKHKFTQRHVTDHFSCNQLGQRALFYHNVPTGIPGDSWPLTPLCITPPAGAEIQHYCVLGCKSSSTLGTLELEFV
jgi:hypothetical protein